MSVSWTRTRQQVAAAVLRKLGVIDIAGTPTTSEYTVVYEAMDGVLKSLHHLGVLWWKVTGTAASLSLVAGQTWANLPVNSSGDMLVMFPETLNITDTDDYPVTFISHADYRAIPSKTDTGRPEQVHIDLYGIGRDTWAASTAYAVGDEVEGITVTGNGVVFRCTTAGTSNSTEPTWTYTVGGTVADNTVTWTVVSRQRVHFFPAPVSAYTASFTYQRIADDTADGSTPDVPQWALLLFRDMVTYRVADDFGATEDRMARFAAEYREAERLLRIMNAPRLTGETVKFVNY